jgi:hypothetical protein
MPSYEKMLKPMARAVERDGEGPGKYVTGGPKIELLPRASVDARAMFELCLPRLESAIQHARDLANDRERGNGRLWAGDSSAKQVLPTSSTPSTATRKMCSRL